MNDTATAEERQEFVAWMSHPQNGAAARQLVQRSMQTQLSLSPDAKTTEAIVQAILQADGKQDGKEIPVRRIGFSRQWYWVAAVLLVLLSGTYFFYLQHSPEKGNKQPVLAKQDILPGKEGAVLTLADGTRMVLDSLGNGVIAMQNGARVVLQNGQLAYDAAQAAGGPVSYNTMSTPRGRQFSLVLPDGSKVWLNSASSISFPTSFSADKRMVTIEGEVYFEVAQHSAKPFIVKARHTEVDVLGTHFNINAYSDEQVVATTLLQGSVRASVLANDQLTEGMILQPGQQAQVAETILKKDASRLKLVNNVAITKVMAWKNGVFDFEDTNLESLMRQLTRWYDIEVVYEKGVPNMEFGGKMSRNMKLSDVIKALKEAGVNCSLEEGRKLVVHE
jgi:ferric-dicitrate binding protein FerR (iron transport regulator)